MQGFIPTDNQELYSWQTNLNKKLCLHALEFNMIQTKQGVVPDNSCVNIAEKTFSDEMIIILENTGTSILRFSVEYTSTDTSNNSEGIVVNPSETISTNIENLGGERNNFLNVTSTSSETPPVAGSYKVTFPNDEIINIVSKGKIAQAKILSTTIKRNEWKAEASSKNLFISEYLKKYLRPFLQKKIKSNDAYTTAIGKGMGIVEEKTYVDHSTMKPLLELVLLGDSVKIIWKKGQAEALRIEVDRNDGKGFTLLTIDTQPNYTDNTEFPVTPAVWKYRAAYVIKDELVGQWSDTVQITIVK